EGSSVYRIKVRRRGTQGGHGVVQPGGRFLHMAVSRKQCCLRKEGIERDGCRWHLLPQSAQRIQRRVYCLHVSPAIGGDRGQQVIRLTRKSNRERQRNVGPCEGNRTGQCHLLHLLTFARWQGICDQVIDPALLPHDSIA